MAAPVPRKKCHPAALKRANHDRIRGIAERSLHANLARVGQPRHLIEPAAADNGGLNGLPR